jgi:hypothetical protein
MYSTCVNNAMSDAVMVMSTASEVARFESPVCDETLWALTNEVKCESVVGHVQPHKEGTRANGRTNVFLCMFIHRDPVGHHCPVMHQTSVETHRGGTITIHTYAR